MSATTNRPTLPPRHTSIHPPDTALLVAVPDAARLLGIGTTLAWDLVRGGDIPSVKLGRRVLVPRAALESLAHSLVSGLDQTLVVDTDASHPPIPRSQRGPARSEPSSSGPPRRR